jgi:hypothetical protein
VIRAALPFALAGRRRGALSSRGRQAGVGLLELILAGFLSFILIGTGGYMFRRQVHEYLDIREQARVQAGLKRALQIMTLEIANAGAALPDSRESFAAQASSLTFAYTDLTGRSCPTGSKARVTFRATSTSQGDRIVQDIACNGRTAPAQVLAQAPQGKLRLAFRYYDISGTITADPGQVKAVDLEVSLQTAGPKAGKTAFKTRAQTVRIQCPNL